MRKISWKAVAATAVGAVVAAGPVAAQTITLTGSTWVSPTHLLTQDVMGGWGREVEKASGGRIKLNMLPKAVAAAPGTFDAVRDGLADVSYTVHGYTPGRFVLSKVAEFPSLGNSSEITSVAYNRIYDRHLAKANEHKGVKVLAVFTHGPGQIYNVKKPITKVEELEGMKFRVGGGVVNDIAKALGMNALLKPAPESYEILSTGVADGTLFPAESIASFKLEKIIKYVTLVPGGLYNTSFVMMMNEDRWNKLSKQDQDIVMSVSGERLARLAGKAWDTRDAFGVDVMKQNGIQTTIATSEFVGAVGKKTGGIEKAWYDEAKKKGVDGAKVLAEFRDEIRKVSQGN